MHSPLRGLQFFYKSGKYLSWVCQPLVTRQSDGRQPATLRVHRQFKAGSHLHAIIKYQPNVAFLHHNSENDWCPNLVSYQVVSVRARMLAGYSIIDYRWHLQKHFGILYLLQLGFRPQSLQFGSRTGSTCIIIINFLFFSGNPWFYIPCLVARFYCRWIWSVKIYSLAQSAW